MKTYMTNGSNEREVLRREENARQAFLRLGRGWANFGGWFAKMCFTLCICAIACGVYTLRYNVIGYCSTDIGAVAMDLVGVFAAVTTGIMVATIVLWFRGAPLCATTIHKQLLRIGLTNANGEAPRLISIIADPKDPHLKTYEFFTPGIPLDDWKKLADKISAILDITIVGIYIGNWFTHIVIRARDGRFTFPDVMLWQDKYILDDDAKFLLGVDGAGEPVIWDVRMDPHAIIAGITGSGKTMIQSLIGHQVLLRNGKLLVIDYKASADWDRPCFNEASIVNDVLSALNLLRDAMRDFLHRKELLRHANARNIDEYREKTGDDLCRVCIIVDEAADLLCTPPTKEEKVLYDEIKSLLETLTRQGRSLGYIVIYGAQRPDQSFSGQIRSNCIRFCGKADDNLRRVVFGESLKDIAANLPEKPGEFVDSNGIKFLAYYYDA